MSVYEKMTMERAERIAVRKYLRTMGVTEETTFYVKRLHDYETEARRIRRYQFFYLHTDELVGTEIRDITRQIATLSGNEFNHDGFLEIPWSLNGGNLHLGEFLQICFNTDREIGVHMVLIP